MVSRTTLWRRLTEIDISLSSYSDISDSELDGVMELLVWDFPRNGIVMMWGQLQSMNIFVTRHSSTTSRRVYNVPSPNYLWHIDVLHCLIHWKIVIHGGIDGFSRRIVYLHASCNNRAETVLHLFRSAVRMFGWPLRVRSDKVGRMWKLLGQWFLPGEQEGRASLQAYKYNHWTIPMKVLGWFCISNTYHFTHFVLEMDRQVYWKLKLIHIYHDLGKMFITLFWKDKQSFLLYYFSYNYPPHPFLCMSNFNSLLHYCVTL